MLKKRKNHKSLPSQSLKSVKLAIVEQNGW
jgi:hypothetical protein